MWSIETGFQFISLSPTVFLPNPKLLVSPSRLYTHYVLLIIDLSMCSIPARASSGCRVDAHFHPPPLRFQLCYSHFPHYTRTVAKFRMCVNTARHPFGSLDANLIARTIATWCVRHQCAFAFYVSVPSLWYCAFTYVLHCKGVFIPSLQPRYILSLSSCFLIPTNGSDYPTLLSSRMWAIYRLGMRMSLFALYKSTQHESLICKSNWCVGTCLSIYSSTRSTWIRSVCFYNPSVHHGDTMSQVRSRSLLGSGRPPATFSFPCTHRRVPIPSYSKEESLILITICSSR